jgi:hypothetical protein
VGSPYMNERPNIGIHRRECWRGRRYQLLLDLGGVQGEQLAQGIQLVAASALVSGADLGGEVMPPRDDRHAFLRALCAELVARCRHGGRVCCASCLIAGTTFLSQPVASLARDDLLRCAWLERTEPQAA